MSKRIAFTVFIASGFVAGLLLWLEPFGGITSDALALAVIIYGAIAKLLYESAQESWHRSQDRRQHRAKFRRNQRRRPRRMANH